MFKNCRFCKGKLSYNFNEGCQGCNALHFKAGKTFFINFDVDYNNMNYYVVYAYEKKNNISMRVSKKGLDEDIIDYQFVLFIEGLNKFVLTPQNFSKRIGVLVLFS